MILRDAPMVDLRLVHACFAFSQQRSYYNAHAKRLVAAEEFVENQTLHHLP